MKAHGPEVLASDHPRKGQSQVLMQGRLASECELSNCEFLSSPQIATNVSIIVLSHANPVQRVSPTRVLSILETILWYGCPCFTSGVTEAQMSQKVEVR